MLRLKVFRLQKILEFTAVINISTISQEILYKFHISIIVLYDKFTKLKIDSRHEYIQVYIYTQDIVRYSRSALTLLLLLYIYSFQCNIPASLF